MYAIIMAGGTGTRLWPLSRRGTPKQLLALTGEGSLLQQTVARLDGLLRPHDIFVITAAAHVRATRAQLPQLPPDNVLGEPLARSTAVAAGLATVLARRESDEVAFVLPADHFVAGEARFVEALREAARTAERGYLVTLGVRPTHPSTGYGYIRAGQPLHRSGPAAAVESFVEKPDAATARALLGAGDHLWNAGIFVWRVSAALAELDRHAPELMVPLRRAVAAGDVEQVFPTLQRISIDYALMEHTANAYVVPAEFQWDDIGDWVALERHLDHEDLGHGANTVIGRHIGLDTSGNILYTEDPEDVIVTLGVHDLVIVKRGHALLLVHKDRVEEIKTLLADERLGGLF